MSRRRDRTPRSFVDPVKELLEITVTCEHLGCMVGELAKGAMHPFSDVGHTVVYPSTLLAAVPLRLPLVKGILSPQLSRDDVVTVVVFIVTSIALLL